MSAKDRTEIIKDTLELVAKGRIVEMKSTKNGQFIMLSNRSRLEFRNAVPSAITTMEGRTILLNHDEQAEVGAFFKGRKLSRTRVAYEGEKLTNCYACGCGGGQFCDAHNPNILSTTQTAPPPRCSCGAILKEEYELEVGRCTNCFNNGR